MRQLGATEPIAAPEEKRESESRATSQIISYVVQLARHPAQKSDLLALRFPIRVEPPPLRRCSRLRDGSNRGFVSSREGIAHSLAIKLRFQHFGAWFEICNGCSTPTACAVHAPAVHGRFPRDTILLFDYILFRLKAATALSEDARERTRATGREIGAQIG